MKTSTVAMTYNALTPTIISLLEIPEKSPILTVGPVYIPCV